MVETTNYFTDYHGNLYRFPRLIGWTMTKTEFKILAVANGGLFMDNHRDEFSFDVVGSNPILKRRMEEYRFAGIRFFYFDTHQDRLAEFQKRLDRAKQYLGRKQI